MRLRYPALLLLLSLFFNAIDARAQSIQPLVYDVDLSDAVHHEARITLRAQDLPDRPVTIWMSRSSPGRYALHEFAKNVYSVVALNATGDTLKVTRPNPYSWKVHDHGGSVKLSYTLYADHADGTYSGIDETHAHLNMPATFMWIMGEERRPVTARFHPPEGSGWKVATQLQETGDPMIYRAPSLAYFLDSPTELSNFRLREWEEPSNRRSETIRIAMHTAQTSDRALAIYTEMAKRVVREQKAVFGELPEYDYGQYTFIACYLPWVYGDGMEHRNSTILTSNRILEGHQLDLLGTLSHEFIHGWSMERLRSAALKPFDFTEANMSKELWFGEGFTSYYDDLTIRRAGLMSDSAYAADISGAIDHVQNAPGRSFYSPVEMSMQAPFVDAATSVDDQNKENTFISYYTWGSVLGLGLDLMLRSRFDRTLDDYMRALWQRFGKTEVGYTMNDLQSMLGEVTQDPAFARRFFDQYVRGHRMIPFDTLLTHAGMALVPTRPGRAFLGHGRSTLEFSDNGAYLGSNSSIGSPLYEAGVDHRDLIMSIDGTETNSPEVWHRIIENHQPGDTVPIRYRSRGSIVESEITFAEHPGVKVALFEELGRALTPEMRQFRESWLGSQVE